MLNLIRKVLVTGYRIANFVFTLGRMAEAKASAEETYVVVESEDGKLITVDSSLDAHFIHIDWDKVRRGDSVAAVKYIERVKQALARMPAQLVDTLITALNDALAMRSAEEVLF